MIGSSDGKQYESPFDVAIGRPLEAPEKAAGASKSKANTKVAPDYDYDAAKAAGVKQDERGHWPDTYKFPNHITFSDESIHNKGGAGHWEDLGKDQWSFTPGSENLKHHSMDEIREYFKKNEPDAQLVEPKQDAPLHIDRTKDVPLAASALHKDGEMYGIAIDKDAPIRPEYDQYIHKHESDEFGYMQDLIKNGMQPGEAYHKAHDHITPMESARVQADLGEKGLEDYKQYWRDVASVSSQKEDPDRHPDAHTTTFGLDEKELGKSFKPQKEAMFRGVKGALTATDGTFSSFLDEHGKLDPSKVLDPLPDTMAAPWFKGSEGKPRQEISDAESKLTLPKVSDTHKWATGDDVHVPFMPKEDIKLGDILHHPELYKSYPDLKDITVRPVMFGSLGLKGAHGDDSTGKETIWLKAGPEKEVHSTLLHELQHAVQERENFAKGGNVEQFLTPQFKGIKEEFQKAEKSLIARLEAAGIKNIYTARGAAQKLDGKHELPSYKDAREKMEKAGLTKEVLAHKEAEGIIQDIEGQAFDKYRNLGGEKESRNVQRRFEYPEAAKIFHPMTTEDPSVEVLDSLTGDIKFK